MFSHRERMLGHVIRWNVAPRLHNQSVAEHSYYVALYSEKLCTLLRVDPVDYRATISYALHHDMPEIVTSDIPGPAKRAFADPDKLEEYEDLLMEKIGLTGEHRAPTDLVSRIVKAADTIDAYFWLSMEVARGNQMLIAERNIAKDRMRMALNYLDLPGDSYSTRVWNDIVMEANKMFGPVTLAPRLDTDLT